MQTHTTGKVIGVDFDDVLLSFNDGFLEFNRVNYGLDMKRSDLVSFDYSKTFPCTPEETVRRVFEFYESEAHDNSEAIEGAVEAIQKLGEHNQLHLVTSRSSKVRPSVEKWLHKMFPNMITSMHFTDQFHGENTQKVTKADVCEQLGIEFFVEDALHHAQDIAESGRKVYLLDTPWNQDENLHPNIKRVFSWDEIVKDLA